MNKISLVEIWSSYLNTLVDFNTGRKKGADVALQIVLPSLVSISLVVCSALGLFPEGLIGTSRSEIVTGIAIVSSLLCAVAVMVFQLRVQIDAGIKGVSIMDREVGLVDELFHDVMWAIVAGFTVVLLLVVSNLGIVGESPLRPFIESVAMGGAINFVLVICMSLKRLSASYRVVSVEWKRPSVSAQFGPRK
jgi:hypothetical protein